MKICIAGDLHLPFIKNAIQFDVLDWMLIDLTKKTPSAFIYAGDVTAFGEKDVYLEFITKCKNTGIPFIYIPGNSDLRDKDTCAEIQALASDLITEIDGVNIVALNDSTGNVSNESFNELEKVTGKTLIFSHHPSTVKSEKFLSWVNGKNDVSVFYAHDHIYTKDDNGFYSLPALDPDKSLGESPSMLYFDTQTGKIEFSHYYCPMPYDFISNLGVSALKKLEDIDFAINNNLKNLELKSNILTVDYSIVEQKISLWRSNGGENLSIHLPDVGYSEGKVAPEKNYFESIELGKKLNADRYVQHVPLVNIKQVQGNPNILIEIADFIADTLKSVDEKVVLGVENMHMTRGESEENRRYGYTPDEVIKFVDILKGKCAVKVGVVFDIGHARNNMPFSKKYQIGSWLALVGKDIVGYHLHQVESGSPFKNHMAFKNIYGALISLASFFRLWADNKINHAPIILEIREQDGYQISLNTFKNSFVRVCDLHSHTKVSRCSWDDAHDLINHLIKMGISVLGMTDHNYWIGENKLSHLIFLRSLEKQYQDKIKILCGIEIATIPDKFDIKSNDEIKNYDYCLIEHITEDVSIVGGNLIEFCSKMPIPCGIAHTDMFAYCDKYGYDYKEFFTKMAENNIFWEINVSYDQVHHYREHQYVKDLFSDKEKLKLVLDSNVCLSIGFDSHRHQDYDGHRVKEWYVKLKNHGFKVVDDQVILNMKKQKTNK